VCKYDNLKKNDEIELIKELERMLLRIRDENTALYRLIKALRSKEKPDQQEGITKKSNRSKNQ